MGSKREISSDFRLIAATHRDLSFMVKQGQFREDFYFRLVSIKIEISPLRDRKSDISSLVTYCMDRKRMLFHESPHKVSEEFMKDLFGYNWPGNVRELFNTIDYACSDAFQEAVLFPKHLPDHIRTFNITNKIKKRKRLETQIYTEEKSICVEKFSLKNYVETKKHKYVIDLMSYTHGNIKSACQLSGLSRGHLYTLLKKDDIRSS